MVAKSMKAAAKKKQPAAEATSASIAAQTQAFLSGGGEITQINTGVSGMQSMVGSKHISLGDKAKASA